MLKFKKDPGYTRVINWTSQNTAEVLCSKTKGYNLNVKWGEIILFFITLPLVVFNNYWKFKIPLCKRYRSYGLGKLKTVEFTIPFFHDNLSLVVKQQLSRLVLKVSKRTIINIEVMAQTRQIDMVKPIYHL